MDQFRISEFREKRQDFIDAIEEEIADLEAEGTPETLQTAKVRYIFNRSTVLVRAAAAAEVCLSALLPSNLHLSFQSHSSRAPLWAPASPIPVAASHSRCRRERLHQELELKLKEVYEDVAIEAVKDEENKFFGLNKYWLDLRKKVRAAPLPLPLLPLSRAAVFIVALASWQPLLHRRLLRWRPRGMGWFGVGGGR